MTTLDALEGRFASAHGVIGRIHFERDAVSLISPANHKVIGVYPRSEYKVCIDFRFSDYGEVTIVRTQST